MLYIILFVIFIALVVHFDAQSGKTKSDKRPPMYDATLEKVRTIRVTGYDNLRKEETELLFSPDATHRHPTNYEFFFDTYALEDRFRIFDYTMVFLDAAGNKLPIDKSKYSWNFERWSTPRLGSLYVSRS